MKRTSILMMLLIGLLGLIVMPALGQVIDPQLYVETPSATCPGTAPCGGDPNFLDPTSIDIGFAGNHTAVSPLLVIVGAPAGNGSTAPTISPSTLTLLAGSFYGLNNPTVATGGTLEGTLMSTGCSDAYSCSGLTTGAGGGSSESFVNWTTSPFPGGATNPDTGVTSFNLFAYAIDIALNSDPMSGPVNSPINIDFSGTVAGDFVIAYNCAVAGSTCSGGNIGETPFTNAGFIPSTGTTTTTTTGGPGGGPASGPLVPEPSAIVLLGSALLAVSVGLRKRFVRS